MNKENLLKMADYIEGISQTEFFMGAFEKKADGHCGTVGCVIGHCTVLDAYNVSKNYKTISGSVLHVEWSEDFTGLMPESNEWAYLFGARWIASDNTPKGAAKRIRYFVKNGLPEHWEKEMQGLKKLSYE